MTELKKISKQGFDTMYQEVWSKRLMKPDVYFIGLKVNAKYLDEFKAFLLKWNLEFDIISINYVEDGHAKYFDLRVATNLLFEISISNSLIVKDYKSLKDKFIILWDKYYSTLFGLSVVFNLDHVIQIKKGVKDKRKILDFKFRFRTGDFIAFSYKNKEYVLNITSGICDLENDLKHSQVSAFEQNEPYEIEKNLYFFCKNVRNNQI